MVRIYGAGIGGGRVREGGSSGRWGLKGIMGFDIKVKAKGWGIDILFGRW